MSAHPWLDHPFAEWTSRSLAEALNDLQIRSRRWRTAALAFGGAGVVAELWVRQPALAPLPWIALALLGLITGHVQAESASLRMLGHLKRWELSRRKDGAART